MQARIYPSKSGESITALRLRPAIGDKTMASIREEWGMCCPYCDKDSGIGIVASVWLDFTADGTSAEGDHEWGLKSLCECKECNFTGKAKDFMVDNITDEEKARIQERYSKQKERQTAYLKTKSRL